MKSSRCFKLTFIVTLIIILLSVYTPFAYATDSDFTSGGIISGADDFIKDANTNLPIEDTSLQKVSSSIYNILLIIGIVIAVIVGVVLGIQFMTGSVSQKSKVKESLIPYIAGCIVIFGAFGIWKLVVTILGQLS